ncbi:hypothetical protein [Butyrivibrio proteoclasticus]|uniref:hypothetical protein n=1 Tax=Butyrivibrio proteoclasticus TaxID=43305 RepID=UPI00047E0D88|nr:hypothetical protein [Butyrivibrio proteoclasticus]
MSKKNDFYLMNQPKPENAVGFCHYKKHNGFVSEKMLKKHQCLGKNCPYLQKYENHEFWIDRARIKAEKKARKSEEYGRLAA